MNAAMSLLALVTMAMGSSLLAEDEDQAILVDTVKNAKGVMTRLEALGRLKDQAILADIAKNDNHAYVHDRILGRHGYLKDQACLADVAKNAKGSDARRMAVEKLCDYALLVDIAKHDESEEVRKAATERLRSWHGIPNASWVSSYFGEIDAVNTGWMPLREAGIPAGDIEVRVWIRGQAPMEGLRFCRNDGEWTGFYTHEDDGELLIMRRRYERNEMNVFEKASYEERRQALKPVYELTPKTMDWTNLWDKVEALGILTLPDSSVLPPSEIKFLKGVSYVVEINDGGALPHVSLSQARVLPMAGDAKDNKNHPDTL